MSKLNMSDLRASSRENLNQELSSVLKKLFALKTQLSFQQLRNTSQIKALRRDVARIKTVLSEKRS